MTVIPARFSQQGKWGTIIAILSRSKNTAPELKIKNEHTTAREPIRQPELRLKGRKGIATAYT